MKNFLIMFLAVTSMNVMGSGLDINSPERDRLDAILQFHKRFPIGTEIGKVTSVIMEKKMGIDLVNSLCNSVHEFEFYNCYEYFAESEHIDYKACVPKTSIFTPANTEAQQNRVKAAFCMRDKIAATIKELPQVNDKASHFADCSGQVENSGRKTVKPKLVEGILKQEATETIDK